MASKKEMTTCTVGLLATLLGIFQLFMFEPWSRQFVHGVVFVLMGPLVFKFGLEEKQSGSPAEDLAADAHPRTSNTPDPQPDLSHYTETQLRDMLTLTDRKRHPERVREIEQRLAAFASRT